MANMIWLECPNHPLYVISECGDLAAGRKHPKRRPGSRLKGTISHDGYIYYNIYNSEKVKTWVAAHRLVAEAFLPQPDEEQSQVAHINNSRIMNHYTNLRWASPASNQHDRFEHGTAATGERNGRATITDDDVRYIRARYAEIKLVGGRVAELDERFNMTRSQIIRIAKRQAWSHVK